ncbi:unnamed protein product [Hyaloperonospora brassicae]|uniref:EB1 C-terminal domain-containing protein n=1 Tax=Hyaloperonospora brassicae TaxID=162125 RepID=A0AAV0U247_HYABA|nr:unnamed protein product [Hyaloperonospora brassicae]
MSRARPSCLGHKRLLLWLNALCETELTRVEQLSSGAIACQVVDAASSSPSSPHRVEMAQVHWTAAHPHEFLRNYALLQQSLAALGVGADVAVARLVRGTDEDHLELLQWLKTFYDRHAPRGASRYDARAQRAKGRGGSAYQYSAGGSAERALSTVTRTKRVRAGKAERCDDAQAQWEFQAMLGTMQQLTITSRGLMEEKEALVAQIRELRDAIKRTEKEREFYAEKLEAIGELVHAVELAKTSSAQTNLLGLSILDVLYATEEDEHDAEVPF